MCVSIRALFDFERLNPQLALELRLVASDPAPHRFNVFATRVKVVSVARNGTRDPIEAVG
jgi:hypothetical protein